MKRWIFLAACLLAPACAIAQINAIPAQPHLLVKGHAEGRYVPDRFSVNLSVEVTDMVPEHARARVEGYMHEILAGLDKNGALPDRTQASSLSITSKTGYKKEVEVFLGTSVSRSVDATFDSAEKLRGFLAGLHANDQ